MFSSKTVGTISAPLRINETTQKMFAFEFPSWQEALRELGSAGWAAKANMATRFPPGTDPALLRWYAEEIGKSDVNVRIAMSRLASKVEAEPVFSRIKAPVLGL